MMKSYFDIVNAFEINGVSTSVKPMGEGLINDTFLVTTDSGSQYVLQRINDAIFQDVDLLQYNIEKVTSHIRSKLLASGVDDVDRRVLHFLHTKDGKPYLYRDGSYWRLMDYISDSVTCQTVDAEYSYIAGKAFGDFQNMLSDLDERLEEVIPCFHNIEFRLQQLREAVKNDVVGRLSAVRDLVDVIEERSYKMCLGERLYREGSLPKRVCHCDTKVNNILFDKQGNVLCVIDLDTVMSSFVFSDYGDFLRSAANTGAEDDQDLSRVSFDMDIFESFTRGYLESATFLLDVERDNLPYAALLFPYMQCVRFLTDYLNGDTYYKIQYPEHNLVRARAQWQLFVSAELQESAMRAVINRYSR